MRQLLMIIALLASAFAYAQEEGKSTFPHPAMPKDMEDVRAHVGVLGGYQESDGAFDPTIEYGVDAGLQPYIPFSVGAELTTSSTDELTRTKLLGRAAYNFGGTIPVLNRSYIGAALGPVWDSDVAGQKDGVHIGWAPVLGFDIPFLKRTTEKTISLGAQAKYLVVEGDSPDALIVNGAMKYWF